MASGSLGAEPSGLGDGAALQGKERKESKPEPRALLLPLSGRWSHAGGGTPGQQHGARSVSDARRLRCS